MTDQPSPLRLRFETVGSIAAIVVGVLAIFVSWDQGRVMRAQQHASVLPAIQINGYINENSGQLSAGLNLRNNGVGPALIHDFELTLDGRAISGWDELSEIAPGESGRNWSSVTGRVLGAGEQITAFELIWAEGAVEDLEALQGFIADMTSSVDVAVCYCSVFEKCFTSRSTPSGSTLPEAVASCSQTSDWDDQVTLRGPESDAS